ncbi:MAG: hypothetical protein ACFFER_14815 [Candidatus Thorarchaeota archaeon]
MISPPISLFTYGPGWTYFVSPAATGMVVGLVTILPEGPKRVYDLTGALSGVVVSVLFYYLYHLEIQRFEALAYFPMFGLMVVAGGILAAGIADPLRTQSIVFLQSFQTLSAWICPNCGGKLPTQSVKELKAGRDVACPFCGVTVDGDAVKG